MQGKGITASPINQQTSFTIVGCANNSNSPNSSASPVNNATSQLKATVTGPKGELLYLKLYQQANGDYVGEYTPVSIGQHRVDVYYAAQPVAGSPFLVPIFDPKLIDVIQLPKELTVGQEAVVEVEWSKCGGSMLFGDVELKVSGGPNGTAYNVVQENLSSTHRKFLFVPNETGLFKASLLLAGHHAVGRN